MNPKTSTALRASTAVCALGLALISVPSFAQTSAPTGPSADTSATTPGSATTIAPSEGAPPANDSGKEIIVTGSRITNPNFVSTSPVTVATAQEFRFSGTTRAEDLVASLPQVYASQSSGLANGADGTATVDLRQLGDTRTLVLLNGRRLPPGDPSRTAGSTLGSAADINNVPAFLIKRVDVLTGGASAAYGADAVAGVVNFILDTELEGLKADGQLSLSVHNNASKYQQSITASGPIYTYPSGSTNDGGNQDISLAFGKSFADGRGHITVYGSYHHQDEVLQASRDYSSCGFTSNEATTSAVDNLACSGSRNSASANFLNDSGLADIGPGAFIIDKTTGQPRAFQNSDRYNYQPIQAYQRPDSRYNAGLFAHFDVSDAFKPYVDFTYMHDHSLAQIAPSGGFGNLFTINCSNPLLTGAVSTALGCTTAGPGSLETVGAAVFKRNVEGGGRVDDLTHEDFRVLAGFKGDLGRAWSYDASASYAKTIYTETYLNDFSKSRFAAAINDCLNPDGSAIADTSCAPYNIFTGSQTIQGSAATGVTQAALDYIQTPGHKSGFTKEIDAQLTFNGKLGEYGIKSPWADQGVDIAIGGEYRKDSLRLNTDSEFSTGDLLGQGAETKPTSGSFNVKEGFIEVSVPLANDKPFFNEFGIDGAYRYSSYSDVGSTNTWKIGATWAPFAGEMSGLKFRGSISRAVRAPTLQDLYAPQQLGLEGSDDACADAPGDPSIAANCLNTARGDPNFASQFKNLVANPASQYNGQTAGAVEQGTTLRPEKATTLTLGAVFAPRSGPLSGFSASVDYYHINLKDTIKTDGYDTIFNQCFDTGSNYYCNLIHRDPNNGSLWLGSGGYIVDPVYNAGRLRNSGIDVSVSYTMPEAKWGRLSGSFSGSYLLKEKVEVLQHNDDGTLVSLGFYDCTGYYGNSCGEGGEGGQPSPKWRHRLRVTWDAPAGNFSLSGNWRYIGGTQFAGADPNPLNSDHTDGGVSKYDRIKAVSYFDLVATFNIAKQFQFRLGANNILDKDPPIIDGADFGNTFVSGNTFPGMYDALGRYLFAGISVTM